MISKQREGETPVSLISNTRYGLPALGQRDQPAPMCRWTVIGQEPFSERGTRMSHALLSTQPLVQCKASF